MHLFNQLSNSQFSYLLVVHHQHRRAFAPVFFYDKILSEGEAQLKKHARLEKILEVGARGVLPIVLFVYLLGSASLA